MESVIDSTSNHSSLIECRPRYMPWNLAEYLKNVRLIMDEKDISFVYLISGNRPISFAESNSKFPKKLLQIVTFHKFDI
jgi:hypothetical protein